MSDDQDFSDPRFVVGAILAQIEDLEPHQQRQVLVDAMTQVAARPKATQETRSDEVAGWGRDDLRRFALDLQNTHDPSQQDDNLYERCMHCHYTRHPCDVYDLATCVLALLDEGRTDQ